MSVNQYREQARAVLLAALMVLSVVAMSGIGFVGSVAANEHTGSDTSPTNEVLVNSTNSSNYDTIQEAVNQEGSNTLITVKPGVYNETVYIGESGGIDNVSIEGAGAGESIINGTDGVRTVEIGRTSNDNVEATNISVSGFAINQNTSSSFAVETTSASTSDITIEKNRIVANGTEAGVGAYLPDATDVRVANNTFAVEGDGEARELLAIGQGSTDVSVEGNTFDGDLARSGQESGGNALEIRASNVTVQDNDFSAATSNDGSTIFVTADNSTIDNNELVGDYTLSDGDTADDIYAVQTDGNLEDLTITENQISNYKGAIQLYGTGASETVTDTTIEGNSIEDVYFGIGQAEDTGTHVIGNDISAQVQGVSGWNTDNFVVENNTITVNSSTVGEGNTPFDQERAVDVSGDNVSVTENAITSTHTAVLVESDATDNVEVNQNILDAEEYGVDASEYDPTLDATENWWGATDGPSGEDDGHGTSVSANVNYEPFLSVDQADDFTVEADFVGIVQDGEISVTAEGLEIENDLGTASGTLVFEIAGQEYTGAIEDGAVDTTIDPTEIDSTTETGETDVDVTNSTISTSVTLVHEASSAPQEGYFLTSMPQPGELHTTGISDATQFNPEDEEFQTFDEGTIGANVHAGIFMHAENADARYGFAYDTDRSDEQVNVGSASLDEGWHVVGSNYNVSDSSTVDLEQDLNTQAAPDDAALVVQDESLPGTNLGNGHDVGAYEAYYVYVHQEDNRPIVLPEYDPTARDNVLPE